MSEYTLMKRRLKKTDKWLYLYCPRRGWHRGFKRRIWVDEHGAQHVDMRGWTLVSWAASHADWATVERD